MDLDLYVCVCGRGRDRLPMRFVIWIGCERVRECVRREKREKSYLCFLDDLKRCEMLGLVLYNFQCVQCFETFVV